MKLSIITINYNNASGLRKTMESVFAQTYKDFEYIVVDGASTDGSLDVIRDLVAPDFKDKLRTVVVGVDVVVSSEPDTGIYNAMNKGVRAAKGEYMLMLNSGDYLVDEHVVDKILPELDGTDIIQGNTISDYPNGRYRNRGYGRSNIDFIDAVEANFLHQASFIKRTLHSIYGLYDESYKRSSDSYFYIKSLALGNATFKYVDIDIANFDTAGMSSIHDELELNEDDRWFGENMSIRMLEMEREVMKRNKLYYSLHSNPLIWKIVIGLARIANAINPPIQYVQKEKIK